MIRHEAIRTMTGTSMPSGMRGMTTGVSYWSWPTLDIAQRNWWVTWGGGARLPFPCRTFGWSWDWTRDCYGEVELYTTSYFPRLSWCSDRSVALKHRAYVVSDCGRVFVPSDGYSLLEFPSIEAAREFLEFPGPGVPTCNGCGHEEGNCHCLKLATV